MIKDDSFGPEDFPGTDEESHLMAQTKAEDIKMENLEKDEELCSECDGHGVIPAEKKDGGQWVKGRLCERCNGEGATKRESPTVDNPPVEPRKGQFYAYLPTIDKTDPTGFDNPKNLAMYATEHYYDMWRMTSTPPNEEQGEFHRPKEITERAKEMNGISKLPAQTPQKPQGPPGKVLTPEQQAIVDQTKPPPVTFTKESMAAWNVFQVCLQGTQFGNYVLVNNPRIGPFPADQAVNLAGWLCVYATKAGLDENKVRDIMAGVYDLAAEQGV